jgi:hypothetical protein
MPYLCPTALMRDEGDGEMTKFIETDAGAAFVATGPSRETSPEIMRAIAFFARNTSEAEALWNGDGFDTVCTETDLWEHVTENGRRDTTEFDWGTAGKNWWPISTTA